jgi:thioredoxin-related protein
MSDHDVSKFCEITGSSAEVAKNFLEIADNDFETAVTLFLENGGGDTGSSERPVSSETSSNHTNALSDEEFARQLQEQDQVRAPIAPMTDILTGGSPSFGSPLWSAPRRENVRPSVFNQGDSTTGSVTDFLSRLQSDITPSHSSAGSASGSVDTPPSSKARRLADLFRPPFDIMYRGSFEEAREAAKDNSKWLMINIQDPTEFACQIMNRDLWSDSFIKDIIKESFIFLQYTNTSPEGTRYSTLYNVNKYPHVGIIDARTGERVKVWEKQLPPTDFMMEVTEFLERHSTDAVPTRHVSDMTEEEQLNAAIAASLTRSNKEEEEKEDTNMEVDEKEQEEEEKTVSPFDEIKAVKRDETTDMANSTRIQLRMGDGSRLIRRFLKTDPVRYIFEFVKSEIPEANERPFELVFNRTQLIDLLDQTIADAGLANAAVNCTFT